MLGTQYTEKLEFPSLVLAVLGCIYFSMSSEFAPLDSDWKTPYKDGVQKSYLEVLWPEAASQVTATGGWSEPDINN